MPKITLPPKVKCWRCGGTGQIVVIAGTIERKPDYPEDMVGIPLRDFEPCDCDDGERYVFDDVAAAIKKLLYFNYEHTGPSSGNLPGKSYRVKIWDGAGEYIAFGPTPTAALVAAVEKHNEG